jgi:ketosteroid isomerase-like protein
VSAQHAIERTIFGYAWAIDSGDAEGVANCFTTDGELHSPGGKVVGRDAIHQDTASKREARAARGIVHHLTSNLMISDETDRAAVVRSVFAVTAYKPEGITVMASGWYDDQLVKDGDAWLIKRRVIHVDGAAEPTPIQHE